MSLDKLFKATKRIASVSEKLEAAKALFKATPEDVNFAAVKHDGVELETVFDTDHVTVTVAKYPRSGGVLPEHLHKDSMEYLIVTKGKHLLKFPAGTTRIMDVGECATIPVGMDHTTVSLTNDAEIIAVCIPPEVAYRKVTNGYY